MKKKTTNDLTKLLKMYKGKTVTILVIYDKVTERYLVKEYEDHKITSYNEYGDQKLALDVYKEKVSYQESINPKRGR